MIKQRIDLLRHGETHLSHTLRGHLDDELTEKGWLQMQSAIQQQLDVGRHWDVIISSPLQRCRLFAEHYAKYLNKPLIITPHLKEMYFGDWEGCSTQWIYENSSKLLANFWKFPTQYQAPNGESLVQFQQRVFLGFSQIDQEMQQNHWQCALLITHGGIIKLLTCLARQQHLDDLLKMPAEYGTLHSFLMGMQQNQCYFEELQC